MEIDIQTGGQKERERKEKAKSGFKIWILRQKDIKERKKEGKKERMNE